LGLILQTFLLSMIYPKDENFYFPAEWHPHEATWLSWPVNIDTWGHKLDLIYKPYCTFIKYISQAEQVNINCGDKIEFVKKTILKYNDSLENVNLFDFKTNDSWCRDHGPGFLINKNNSERLIIDWEYNAWGGKYPPYRYDNEIPSHIAAHLKLKSVKPNIVIEGGSVEFNGEGTVLTSSSCLLNTNRNPHLTQVQIEAYLQNYYGVSNVLWVNDGIVGDDTDGHIDDTVRFVNKDTVITMVEVDSTDENHEILKENLKLLKKMRLENGKQLNIIEIEMPRPVFDKGERLPASYANFYISNSHVIVPVYNCNKDDVALDILASQFKDRKIIGIDSTDIIWGLGSFHCLSQQEPKAKIIA
jgi:agmatine deiminase